ncbi:hypothetical protein OIO90_003719 [Microbotryomycetes sp. JL221]|nr:hypothetical protein OIO90_003719 [Microbotryomycetes sp. JL221]
MPSLTVTTTNGDNTHLGRQQQADTASSPAASNSSSESHDVEHQRAASQRLPPELVRLCLEFVGDYELVTALGITTSRLPVTSPWLEFATPLDKAILESSQSLRPIEDAIVNGSRLWSDWGTRVMVRFAFLDTLEFLHVRDPVQFRKRCKRLLPVVASAWGRVKVLEWARDSTYKLDPEPATIAEAMEEASRHGQVAALDFWLGLNIPLHYTEAALASATIKRQLGSLQWWRESGLPLKIGNVLDFASMEGSTVTLDWWAKSGLPVRYSKQALHSISRSGNVKLLDWWKASKFMLDYDKEVIIIATRHGQTKALTWWLESGLDLEFRFFDIEAALEDAVVDDGDHDAVVKWWEDLGYNENMHASEWSKLRNLRTAQRIATQTNDTATRSVQ